MAGGTLEMYRKGLRVKDRDAPVSDLPMLFPMGFFWEDSRLSGVG
jgi:hypothetical protein